MESSSARRLLVAALLGAASSFPGCRDHARSSAPTAARPTTSPASSGDTAPVLATTDINPRLLRRFQPLPAIAPAGPEERTAELVNLGRTLYNDRRLSADGTVSCNSCHDLHAYGVDHKKTPVGQHQTRGRRNSPSVYQSAGLFAQFWDGRSPNVEAQVEGPLLNATEMGMQDERHVVVALEEIDGYPEAFKKAFPDESHPITLRNVGRAIGAFERGLQTPGRWDMFLRGDGQALSNAEKDGLKTFLNVGCMVCHTGQLVGGSMFERLGVVEPWPNEDDRGRREVTKAAADDMVFKVPSLRNVDQTAPYFHDGSVATLPEAVKMMGRHQLGLELSDSEVSSITTWLKSLTGDIPTAYIASQVPVETTPSSEISEPRRPSSGAVTCGASPLPDCPLQGWMKSNVAAAMQANDFERLKKALERLSALGPSAYSNWSGFAELGAAAAAEKNMDGVRQSCRSCHSAYREAYRQDFPARPLH